MKEAGQHGLKDAKTGRKCSKTPSLFSSPVRLCVIKQVFLHRKCSISSNTGTSPLLCLSQRRISLQKRPNFVSCDTIPANCSTRSCCGHVILQSRQNGHFEE